MEAAAGGAALASITCAGIRACRSISSREHGGFRTGGAGGPQPAGGALAAPITVGAGGTGAVVGPRLPPMTSASGMVVRPTDEAAFPRPGCSAPGGVEVCWSANRSSRAELSISNSSGMVSCHGSRSTAGGTSVDPPEVHSAGAGAPIAEPGAVCRPPEACEVAPGRGKLNRPTVGGSCLAAFSAARRSRSR